MKKSVNSYYDSQDFISEFISENCTYGRNLSITRKQFLQKLQSEYPKETRGLSDRTLTEMVSKIDGVSYRRSTGKIYYFFGIGWNDSPQQQDFGEDFPNAF